MNNFDKDENEQNEQNALTAEGESLGGESTADDNPTVMIPQQNADESGEYSAAPQGQAVNEPYTTPQEQNPNPQYAQSGGFGEPVQNDNSFYNSSAEQQNPYSQGGFGEPMQNDNSFYNSSAEQQNPYSQSGEPIGQQNPYSEQGGNSVGQQPPYAQSSGYGEPMQNDNSFYNSSAEQQNPYSQVSEPVGQQNPYSQGGEPVGQQNPYAQSSNPVGQQNPYAQSGEPQFQYLPYTPGTVLPPGVKPVFINGGWYYPSAYNQPAIKKKKMATSVKVLIIIIIALTVVFSGILVWYVVTNNSGGGEESNKSHSFLFEEPTEKATTKKADDVGKYADPNGPEIQLAENSVTNGSTEKAYEALSDSVVSVSVYDEDDEPTNSVPNSEGTGIIISSDGYIVTNSHVINDTTEGYDVWVTKKDGSTYPVVIVGCDSRTDLAVLRCDDAVDWKAAVFANSDDLKVGQDVIAIGSPGGSVYSSSLTRGIISALNRQLSGNAGTYIQTDAAINPGNSGGPLANLNGQVIGINTIKVVDTQYEGMGFAIPSTQIKKVADQLIKNGYVPGRARLGIVGKELSKSMANYYGMSAGIIINSIEDDSPLKGTEIKEGDVITKIDDKSITTFAELFNTLDEYKKGDSVTLTVSRYDSISKKSSEFTVDVTLEGD